jgi:hypothetical protein
MELGWKAHFEEIVIPAWQAYRAAEKSLSEAVKSGVDDAILKAQRTALREGGAAILYLHHYLEIVWQSDQNGCLKSRIQEQHRIGLESTAPNYDHPSNPMTSASCAMWRMR